MTYRIEQLIADTWKHVETKDTQIGWQAIDNCASCYRATNRFPTRVFEPETGLIHYYLDRQGRRDYSKEQHCTGCAGTTTEHKDGCIAEQPL